MKYISFKYQGEYGKNERTHRSIIQSHFFEFLFSKNHTNISPNDDYQSKN